jgi:hypothetical protein
MVVQKSYSIMEKRSDGDITKVMASQLEYTNDAVLALIAEQLLPKPFRRS